MTAEGALIVNEIAPRPHNSGHYTIDACVTSQFEQQARVLAGLPLGDARQHEPAVMVNLLGDIWFEGSGAARASPIGRTCSGTRRRSSTCTARPSRDAAARWGTSPALAPRSTTRSRRRARSSADSASRAPKSFERRIVAAGHARHATRVRLPASACSTSRGSAGSGVHALPRRSRRRRRQGRGHRRRRLCAQPRQSPRHGLGLLSRGEPQQAEPRDRSQGPAGTRGISRAGAKRRRHRRELSARRRGLARRRLRHGRGHEPAHRLRGDLGLWPERTARASRRTRHQLPGLRRRARPDRRARRPAGVVQPADRRPARRRGVHGRRAPRRARRRRSGPGAGVTSTSR